jgi:hypothetical protein
MIIKRTILEMPNLKRCKLEDSDWEVEEGCSYAYSVNPKRKGNPMDIARSVTVGLKVSAMAQVILDGAKAKNRVGTESWSQIRSN